MEQPSSDGVVRPPPWRVGPSSMLLLVLLIFPPLLLLLLLLRCRSLRRVRRLLRTARRGKPLEPYHANGESKHGVTCTARHDVVLLTLPIQAVLVLGGCRHRELEALARFHARRLHVRPDGGGDDVAIVLDYDRVPLIISSGAIGEEDLVAAVAMCADKEAHGAMAVQRLREQVVFDRRAVCTGRGACDGLLDDETRQTRLGSGSGLIILHPTPHSHQLLDARRRLHTAKGQPRPSGHLVVAFAAGHGRGALDPR